MRESFYFGLAGLLVGGLFSWIAASRIMVSSDNQELKPSPTAMVHDMSQKNMSMDTMVESLRDKKGDDFDKAFIQGMTIHHQGAIEMAELAKNQANHLEIKSMAEDVISAQSKEINQMSEWQKNWGY